MKNLLRLEKSAAFRCSRLAVLFCAVLGLSLGTPPAVRAQNTTQAAPVDRSGQTLKAFDAWLGGYLRNGSGQSLEEGLRLARARRATLLQLIQKDPARALAATVPEAARRRLPAALLAEMETTVSGMGNLRVLDSLAARSQPSPDRERRIVELNGQTYQAFVYGRRVYQATKHAIPLRGTALAGFLALDEKVLRQVDPSEVAALGQPIRDLRTAQQHTLPESQPILAEMAGQIYRFATASERKIAESRLQKAESIPGPKAGAPAEQTLTNVAPVSTTDAATTAWTTGRKTVLVIRVDFLDLAGNPHGFGATYTAAKCQEIMTNEVAPYYLHSSYGLTSLISTVSPKVYRMPQTALYYATVGGDDELHSAAEDAASADYDVDGYDRVVVLFSFLGDLDGSTIDYGGLGEIGGPKVWINGDFEFRLVAHELGHTYGLYHANVWKVNDGNPVSDDGEDVEYGDDFDTMGSNFADDHGVDFNPWFKNTLGWLADGKVQTVTSSGTYRVYRFDNAGSTGSILGLKIARSTTENFWVGIRRNFPSNASMQNGAYIILGYNYARQSDLLDLTTPGASIQDAALALNATFTDADSGIRIKPIGIGGVSPNEYMDIQVTMPAAISLADALDTSAAIWTTGGDAVWSGTASESFDGVDAAGSGSIADNGTTWLKTSVSGPGSVSFRWKVSSEANFDFLKFSIDGVQQASISGAVEWQAKSATLAAGAHVLQWTYSKDGASVDGQDAAWVDAVSINATPGGAYTPPSFFAGETALGNGVEYLAFANGNYFGYYSYLADPHYIYHFDLGYEYVFDAVDGKGGVYLYDFASTHFFYSSPVFPFPYLYDFTLHAVLYYYPDPSSAGHYNTSGVRYFYNFNTGKIFSQ